VTNSDTLIANIFTTDALSLLCTPPFDVITARIDTQHSSGKYRRSYIYREREDIGLQYVTFYLREGPISIALYMYRIFVQSSSDHMSTYSSSEDGTLAHPSLLISLCTGKQSAY
jgi:hypothetical protein